MCTHTNHRYSLVHYSSPEFELYSNLWVVVFCITANGDDNVNAADSKP